MALDKALDIVTQTLPHSKKNFDTINLNALNSQLIWEHLKQNLVKP